MLKRFYGVWRKGKNLHDYKTPNNPDNNEWHNLALEDIGIYWDLPNFDECKHYYFHLTEFNLDDETAEGFNAKFPLVSSKDEIIDDHYKWWTTETTDKALF